VNRKSILLYAIDGVGLGHVVRLAQFEQILTTIHPEHRLFFYSNSAKARHFFRSPGIVIDDDPILSWRDRVSRILGGFERVVKDFRPDVILCDTHWPKPHMQSLRQRGVRTALVLRLLRSDLMRAVLSEAKRDFDIIVFPHDPEELLYDKSLDSETLQEFCSQQCAFIGPVARVPQRTAAHLGGVIFSLGGGGEYHNPRKGNFKSDYLKVFAMAAKQIAKHHDVFLAAGPFLSDRELAAWPYGVLRSTEFHARLGAATTLIARPGYNSCWEAVAAGARLVLVGSHIGMEDTTARAKYLQSKGVAAYVDLNAGAITDAVMHTTDCKPSHDPWRQKVNKGLRLAVADILGDDFLRDAQFAEFPRPHELTATSPLVARFDDVDICDPSAAVLDVARLAISLGYRTQLHCYYPTGGVPKQILSVLKLGAELWSHGRWHERARLNTRDDFLKSISILEDKTGHKVKGVSSPYDMHLGWWKNNPIRGRHISILQEQLATEPTSEEIVDVCHFPGPRLRSELWIAARLRAMKTSQRGICFHVDRMPRFVSEHLLYSFAPYEH
jgi:predicted glycosyltransferase